MKLVAFASTLFLSMMLPEAVRAADITVEGEIITVGTVEPSWCQDAGHEVVDLPGGGIDCRCAGGFVQVGTQFPSDEFDAPEPMCALDWGVTPNPPSPPTPPDPPGQEGASPRPDPEPCPPQRLKGLLDLAARNHESCLSDATTQLGVALWLQVTTLPVALYGGSVGVSLYTWYTTGSISLPITSSSLISCDIAFCESVRDTLGQCGYPIPTRKQLFEQGLKMCGDEFAKAHAQIQDVGRATDTRRIGNDKEADQRNEPPATRSGIGVFGKALRSAPGVTSLALANPDNGPVAENPEAGRRGEVIAKLLRPRADGKRIDWCLGSGRCGKPSADRVCTEAKFEQAVWWAIRQHPETAAVDTGGRCAGRTCRALEVVYCRGERK